MTADGHLPRVKAVFTSLAAGKDCFVVAVSFDEVVRSLVGAESRRTVARGVAALLFGGRLLGTGSVVEAKKCPPCRKKNRQGRCKKKRPNGRPCESGGTCQNGRCVVAFCADKGCVDDVRCERSGSACFCQERAGSGERFCGLAPILVINCDTGCTGGACVQCGGGDIGCSAPCPDPL